MANTYINHKTGETIDTEMTELEAVNLLPAGNNFAQDLAKKWKESPNSLSENQKFWIMKLALEQVKEKENFFPCDTSEILEKLEKSKLYVKYKELGIDMTLYPGGMIWLNGKKFGAYNEKGLAVYGEGDPQVIHKFLLVFAKEGFHNCLDRIGKATGVCCYCGRVLTHPISIEVGVGPICADKHGRPFPFEEYAKTLK